MSKRKTLGENNPLAGLGDDPLDFIGRAPSRSQRPQEAPEPEPEPEPVQEKKATYKLPVELVEAIRDASYWSRRTVNEIAADLLRRGLLDYEGENGELKPRPDREG